MLGLRLRPFLSMPDLPEVRASYRQFQSFVANLVAFFSTSDLLDMLEHGSMRNKLRALKMLSRFQSHLGVDHQRCCDLVRRYLYRKSGMSQEDKNLAKSTYIALLNSRTWTETLWRSLAEIEIHQI